MLVNLFQNRIAFPGTQAFDTVRMRPIYVNCQFPGYRVRAEDGMKHVRMGVTRIDLQIVPLLSAALHEFLARTKNSLPSVQLLLESGIKRIIGFVHVRKERFTAFG